MAQYEEQAFANLPKTKAQAKGKATSAPKAKAKAQAKASAKATAKGKASAQKQILKRPATRVQLTKPLANPEQNGHYTYPGPAGPFGCIRCRGNIKGCDNCVQPTFEGLRFNSRANWVAWKLAKDGHL